jgi:hypothetical protein
LRFVFTNLIVFVLIFGSIPVESTPYIVRTEVGTEVVIRSYDLELKEIAEYRENITIGPTYEQVRNEAISIYDNPKLEFITDSPFNIINRERIIFENLINNSISSIDLQQFLSGSNEVTKLSDFSLDKIVLEARSRENLLFDGLSDTKFIWLDQNKIWKDVDGGGNSLDQFKMNINYTMEIFDVASNIVTNIPINWTNFPARFIVDEADTTEYNFELNWRGSAIRDRFQYQVFYYSQYPRDDQSTAPSFSKIFVIQFDIDSYTFNHFIFDFDQSIDPDKYSTVVFSTDGTKIFLGPWIEGRTIAAGESTSNKFSEDQIGIIIDVELNTTKLYTLFTENDNSQIGIRYVTLSENGVIFVKNGKELISYNHFEETSNILVSDIDLKIGREASTALRDSLVNNRGTVLLINNHFLVMYAGTIIDEREEGGGEIIAFPWATVLLAIGSVLLIRRKFDQLINH